MQHSPSVNDHTICLLSYSKPDEEKQQEFALWNNLPVLRSSQVQQPNIKVTEAGQMASGIGLYCWADAPKITEEGQ